MWRFFYEFIVKPVDNCYFMEYNDCIIVYNHTI